MQSLKAFLLSLTCIALCFGRSVAQTQQTDSSTAPAASASSAAPAAAAPASPEQIQAAVAEIKYVAEEGQRMGELYNEAKAAGECEEDDCELFHAMIELGQRYIELKHFLTSHGLKVEGYEYELCDKDDECPLTYDQHLSLRRPAADFVLYSTGEAAGATCGEMRWGMRELIVQILKAESAPQHQRELKNDLHYVRCSFSECLGWAPTNCDIYDLAHLGLRNSPPPPAPGAGERVPPPRPASLLLHDRIQGSFRLFRTSPHTAQRVKCGSALATHLQGSSSAFCVRYRRFFLTFNRNPFSEIADEVDDVFHSSLSLSLSLSHSLSLTGTA
jgi:hypothetical protein